MIVETHLHTFFSDGLHSPLDMARRVKSLKLNGFAITDHDTVKGQKAAKIAAKQLKLKLIPGIEVSSTDGHVIGLFVEKEIPRLSAAEVVELIHEEGGIAVAAHPHCRFRSSVGDLIKTVKFDYVETFNTRVPWIPDNWKTQGIAKEMNLKGIAASDAHAIEEVGFGTTRVKDFGDFENGKAKVASARWTGPWLIGYGKFRRFLRKNKLY
ncbi:TPA: PHP domain-containing protein [archaeon]|nr:PHP domain-containing protein [Candidatus Naiadarchaeales archaeon SRR2090159.bin1288]